MLCSRVRREPLGGHFLGHYPRKLVRQTGKCLGGDRYHCTPGCRSGEPSDEITSKTVLRRCYLHLTPR